MPSPQCIPCTPYAREDCLFLLNASATMCIVMALQELPVPELIQVYDSLEIPKPSLIGSFSCDSQIIFEHLILQNSRQILVQERRAG